MVICNVCQRRIWVWKGHEGREVPVAGIARKGRGVGGRRRGVEDLWKGREEEGKLRQKVRNR